MAEHAVVQEEELLSLSMRPFQQAKQSGRTICFKSFEEDGVVNFFLEGAGLSQRFRTMHHINAVLDSYCEMQSSFSGLSRRGNGEDRGAIGQTSIAIG